MSIAIPLWIIAICAIIWTVRMVLTGALFWAAARWPYGTAPKPVQAFARVVSGRR